MFFVELKTDRNCKCYYTRPRCICNGKNGLAFLKTDQKTKESTFFEALFPIIAIYWFIALIATTITTLTEEMDDEDLKYLAIEQLYKENQEFKNYLLEKEYLEEKGYEDLEITIISLSNIEEYLKESGILNKYKELYSFNTLEELYPFISPYIKKDNYFD